LSLQCRLAPRSDHPPGFFFCAIGGDPSNNIRDYRDFPRDRFCDYREYLSVPEHEEAARPICSKPENETMAKGDAFWRAADKRAAMKSAEEQGLVADSKEVRIALMERVHSGEITLVEAQAQLARIKRGAKANGQVTRNQAYRAG
jgi:hypothetical protein